jgi:hypothetical protein
MPNNDLKGEHMKKLISLLLTGFAFAGCVVAGRNPSSTLVLTQDNCKVYRFYDKGQFHYFSSCGSVESEGK